MPKTKAIFAIDPGSTESGYVVVELERLRPIICGKWHNDDLLNYQIPSAKETFDLLPCIEMVASYGMPVGREVFETCVWIGRFYQKLVEDDGFELFKPPKFIYRSEEKLTICHSSKANDATIKQALVDRFAKGQKNYGKGTKKFPGWFHGFKADIWQAYAIAITYYDKYLDNLEELLHLEECPF